MTLSGAAKALLASPSDQAARTAFAAALESAVAELEHDYLEEIFCSPERLRRVPTSITSVFKIQPGNSSSSGAKPGRLLALGLQAWSESDPTTRSVSALRLLTLVLQICTGTFGVVFFRQDALAIQHFVEAGGVAELFKVGISSPRPPL